MGDLVLGIDFGTDSVRALVVEASTGREVGNEVVHYPRWMAGKYCDPAENRFRQHPLDSLESMEGAVAAALSECGDSAGESVVGIGVDTTGSTPCAVDGTGTPLALTPGFEENPNAMFILWKDHTSVAEAERINTVARTWGGQNFTRYSGGVYSSEWFWAKILHVLRSDPAVGDAAASWVEHADWIPGVLTSTTSRGLLKRSRCAAGHKAMWHQAWNGLPSEEFLREVDPLLQGIRGRLYRETHPSDTRAGGLNGEWAAKLSIPEGTSVAVGAFDAHMGAVGGEIGLGTLVKIMGTSTCDVIVAKKETIGTRQIAGICGQVDGSVVPGLIGLEAGQSAYGDVYAWFRDLLAWPLRSLLADTAIAEEAQGRILDRLGEEAQRIPLEASGPVALDWLNGRRTPFADQTLKGAIAGITLGTTAPLIYRSLVEATAYGSRAIVEQFRAEGVPIDEVIALGGVSQKADFVMQVAADVLGMPIKIARSEQCVALGAAMFGAVVGGVYPDVVAAQHSMGSGHSTTHTPDPDRAARYTRLYERYRRLGTALEAFLQDI